MVLLPWNLESWILLALQRETLLTLFMYRLCTWGAIIFYLEGGRLFVGGPEFFGVVKVGTSFFFSGSKGGHNFFRVTEGGDQNFFPGMET